MMKETIQRYIEIPLHELQTEKARDMDITITNCCCVCGKKLKKGAKTKNVHLLENGNIISYDGSDISGSQGLFPVGMECAKKLIINFAF